MATSAPPVISTFYTLADLDQRVLDRLEGNSIFYTQPERTRAINEAIQALNLFTGFLQTNSPVTGGTQANRVFYDVPQGILFPMAVIYRNSPLRRSSIQAVAGSRRDWTKDTSLFSGPVAHWIPIGLTKFAINPADAVSGNLLVISGVQEPTPLANPTDSLPIPDEFIGALEEYASHILTLKEGGKPFFDSAAMYIEFQKRVKEYSLWRNLQQPKYRREVWSPKKI